jgi:hypothetical protein
MTWRERARNADLFRILRSLPMIRFALSLGGGVMATAGVAVLIAIGGEPRPYPRNLPAEVAIAAINGKTAIALALCALIAIVLIALAWGRVGKISGSFNGASLDIDLDSKGDAP